MKLYFIIKLIVDYIIPFILGIFVIGIFILIKRIEKEKEKNDEIKKSDK